MAEEIATLPDRGSLNGALKTHCHVCANGERTEQTYLEMLARRISEPRFAQSTSRGALSLCLPHLRQIHLLAGPRERELLRKSQTARLRALANDLAEFSRKSAQSTQQDREPFGPGRDAWIRVLRLYDGGLIG